MNTSRLARWALLGTVVPLLSAMQLLACSEDDSSPVAASSDASADAETGALTRDGGAEADGGRINDAGDATLAADSGAVTLDSTVANDAPQDAPQADAADAITVVSEAGTDGSTTATDAAADSAATTDAQSESAADSATDAGAPDASSLDAGATDSASDADASDAPVIDPALLAFPSLVAEALCQHTATCCGVPTSSFNMQLCESDLWSHGFRSSSFGADLLSRGNVIFDAGAAQACEMQIGNIVCSNQTSSDVLSLYQNCFGALTGTLGIGGACRGPIECAPGEFCNAGDGGTGTCQALHSANQSCGDFGTSPSDYSLPQSECSYRASGDTNLSCQFYDTNTMMIRDAGWVCGGGFGANASCVTDLDCTSRLCVSGKCAASESFASPASCNKYTIVDAGGPG